MCHKVMVIKMERQLVRNESLASPRLGVAKTMFLATPRLGVAKTCVP